MPLNDHTPEFPRRLHHSVPGWVRPGSTFHIRLRITRCAQYSLITPTIAKAILASVQHYHVNLRWYCSLFLLMPDHAHALLAFPRHLKMIRVIGDWKHYARSNLRIDWQTNFFDHRIRSQAELQNKYLYILRNPVAKGLCATESDWPWVWKPDDL